MSPLDRKIPESTGRLIAIGDCHGHVHFLQKLLEEINPQPEDQFVFLGDYIDRGPDSKGVIDEILNLKSQVYPILGNHEEMVLACLQGGRDEHKFWCKFGGIEALASYGVEKASDLPREHLLFIARCNEYLESEKFIFVHASCHPQIPLEKNSGQILRWAKLQEDLEPHMSGKTVICGHTAQRKIFDNKHLVCIDTGCGIWAGGQLTALDVKSGKIWQFGGNAKKVKISQRENHE